MTKSEFKEKIKAAGVKQWQIANLIGIHEKTLTGWLHCDVLPEERATRIEDAFNKIEKGALKD